MTEIDIETNQQRKDPKSVPRFAVIGLGGLLLVACVVALVAQPSSAPSPASTSSPLAPIESKPDSATELQAATTELPAATMNNVGQFLRGYDVMFGNPMNTEGIPLDPGFREQVFHADADTAVPDADGRYSLPQGVSGYSCQGSCSLEMSSKIIDSASSYKDSLEVKASVEGSGWGASFSASTDYKKVSTGTTKDHKVFVQSSATCCVWQMNIKSFAHPKLSENFQHGVEKVLTKDYNKESYLSFIKAFGTHYLSSAVMGASYGKQYQLSKTEYTKMVSTGLNIKAAAKYASEGFSGGASAETDVQKEESKSFSSETEDTKIITTGAVPTKDGVTSWVQSALKDPLPVSFDLVSIANLIDDPVKKKNLGRALGEYCEDLKSQGVVMTCKAPEDQAPPSPPPTSCRFCANKCGGSFPTYGGALMTDQNWPKWLNIYPESCDGLLGHTNSNAGAQLCCQAKPQAGSCRICESCGGSFSNSEGKIMRDQNWPNWIEAYDNSCNGEARHRNNPGGGFSVCCSEQPLCTLCASCGGDWPQETSTLSNDQHWPNFFGIRDNQCTGEPSVRSYSDGVSLCCKTSGP